MVPNRPGAHLDVVSTKKNTTDFACKRFIFLLISNETIHNIRRTQFMNNFGFGDYNNINIKYLYVRLALLLTNKDFIVTESARNII